MAAFDSLFTEMKIPYQIATMGNSEYRAPGASDAIHSPLFAEGIDLGIPLIGMHRHSEITSVIDNYFLAKTIQHYFGIKDHKRYLPKRI